MASTLNRETPWTYDFRIIVISFPTFIVSSQNTYVQANGFLYSLLGAALLKLYSANQREQCIRKQALTIVTAHSQTIRFRFEEQPSEIKQR
jgi:hypothetical protein